MISKSEIKKLEHKYEIQLKNKANYEQAIMYLKSIDLVLTDYIDNLDKKVDDLKVEIIRLIKERNKIFGKCKIVGRIQ